MIGSTLITDNIGWRSELAPNLDTSSQIMDRCQILEPLLKSQGFELVEHRVGLRPSRLGGIRHETSTGTSRSGKTVKITYNYGHGGYGWQSSWGSAKYAIDLALGKAEGQDEKEVKTWGIPEVWKALRKSIEADEAQKGRSKL